MRAILLLFVLLVAASAQAAPSDGSARAAFEEGRRAYNLGRWQEAIDGFEKAYRISADPALLYNIAQAHRQAGHYSEAITIYRAFLRELPDTDRRASVEARIAELEALRKAAAASPDNKRATPAPAVDRELSEPTLSPGPPPAAPPPVTAPPLVTAPAPARPLIAVRSPEPQPETSLIDRSGRERQPPPPTTSSARWVPWLGVAVTAALAGGAVVGGLSVKKQFETLRDSCGRTKKGCTDEHLEPLKSRTLLTNVFIAAASVSAVATGVAFYATSGEAEVQVAWRF